MSQLQWRTTKMEELRAKSESALATWHARAGQLPEGPETDDGPSLAMQMSERDKKVGRMLKTLRHENIVVLKEAFKR